MDDRLDNSRSSSRYSKSVVFPQIKKNSPEREPSYSRRQSNGGHNMDDQLGERRSLRAKSHRNDQGSSNEFSKYVLERLEFTERVLEDERRGRSLLEDHLRTVMANVQRLSKDMAMLQQQVKSEEENVHSQSMAMKNLELHQVAGIGDVWNRLTLGDLNSIKLAGELNKVAGEVSVIKRNEEESHRRLNKLQIVVDSLVTKLEKVSLDCEKNIRVLKVKLETQNQVIEEKIKSVVNKYEGRNHVDFDDKMEQHCSEMFGNVEHRLDTSLEIQKSWQASFEGKVAQLEKNVLEVMEMKGRKEEDLVRRIQELSASQHTAFQKSHDKLKDSYREAFRAVYESITTMQTVLEAKLKMTEADLKTSINSILRTISYN